MALAASAQGQTLVSSRASVTFNRVVGRLYTEPLKGELAQYIDLSTASGSVAWTSTVTGALSSSCSGSPCLYFVTQYSNGAANATGTATTTAARYALRFRNTSGLAIGTYTGTIVITTALSQVVNIAVTLNVIAPTLPVPQFAYKAGYPVNCTATNALWAWPDTCTQARMPMNTETAPAVGASRVDENFGHTVRYATPYGCETQYGGLRAFSAANSYLWAPGRNGSTGCGIIRLSDYTVLRSTHSPAQFPTGFDPDRAAWSSVEDSIFYFLVGAELRRWDVVANTITVQVDFATRGGSLLRTGGQAGPSRDEVWAIFVTIAGVENLCWVDIPAIRRGATVASIPCAVANQYGAPDFVMTGPFDLTAQRRYAFADVGTRGTVIYELADGVMSNWLMPELPDQAVALNENGVCETIETCSPQGHGSIYRERGRALMWLHTLEGTSQSCSPACDEAYSGARLAGAETFTQLTGGGLLPWFPAVSVASHQSSFPLGLRYELLTRLAAFVNTATAANPVVLTATDFQTTPQPISGWTVGQSIRITGSAGGTFGACLDGLWTISAVTTNTITIPANCTGAGSYTARSALVGDATPPGSPNVNMNTVFLHDTVNRVVRPIFSLRTAGWVSIAVDPGWAQPPYLNSYYYSPRCSASWDESLVACTTNDGFLTPQATRVVVASTEHGTATRLAVTSVEPSDTATIIRFMRPLAASCTVTAWASPSTFTSSVFSGSVTSGLGGVAVVTGLSASSNYVARLSCGAAGGADVEIRTLPTLSGNGTARAVKGGGGTIAHGATSSLGSTCTSPCLLTVAKGLYWFETGPVVVQ